MCHTLRDDSLSDFYSTSKEILDNNYNTRTSRRSSPEHSKYQSRQNSSRKGSRSVHRTQQRNLNRFTKKLCQIVAQERNLEEARVKLASINDFDLSYAFREMLDPKAEGYFGFD